MFTNAHFAAPVEKTKISFRGAFWIACVSVTTLFWGGAAIVIWRLM